MRSSSVFSSNYLYWIFFKLKQYSLFIEEFCYFSINQQLLSFVPIHLKLTDFNPMVPCLQWNAMGRSSINDFHFMYMLCLFMFIYFMFIYVYVYFMFIYICVINSQFNGVLFFYLYNWIKKDLFWSGRRTKLSRPKKPV